MSDEEREALRNFKSEYETCNHNSSDLIIELDDAKIILNLIEKYQKEIEDWKFTAKYVEENYVSKERIKKDLKTCEQVYEREMKPYQKEYGLDVTYLSKKEKEKLINTRNCLIVQMETYKQLLGGEQ